ncbi:MAG: porin family protein [Sulfurovum sp.]|nr:porin family protein [Sulfurovum sp.]MDD3603415.1 porin family protein [Sulfurovum sp.]
MKKITASIVAALAMNAFAFAGGDIAPVEPEVTVPEVVEAAPGAFYVGLGYSYMKAESDPFEYQRYDISEGDITANSLLLLAGYKYNQYLGLEARYTMNVGDPEFDYGSYPSVDLDGDMTNVGIYAKGMYPITEAFDVYALLGYGQVTIDTDLFGDLSESGFQWGLGASYAVTENIGVFVDYTRLYDDTGFDGYLDPETDVTVDSINVGMTYTF